MSNFTFPTPPPLFDSEIISVLNDLKNKSEEDEAIKKIHDKESRKENDGKIASYGPTNRMKYIEDLSKIRPSAINLFRQILTRSKQDNADNGTGLNRGESFIGDFESYGVTRSIYRADIIFLKKHHLITTRTNPEVKHLGTIATIIDDVNFSIKRKITI
jgi:hypothetical protein